MNKNIEKYFILTKYGGNYLFLYNLFLNFREILLFF